MKICHSTLILNRSTTLNKTNQTQLTLHTDTDSWDTWLQWLMTREDTCSVTWYLGRGHRMMVCVTVTMWSTYTRSPLQSNWADQCLQPGPAPPALSRLSLTTHCSHHSPPHSTSRHVHQDHLVQRQLHQDHVVQPSEVSSNIYSIFTDSSAY